MRLLWLCNMMPGAVQAHINGGAGDGLWVDHVLSDLRETDMTIHVICPGKEETGSVDARLSYAAFRVCRADRYSEAQEQFFREQVKAFRPDVIHIWGTEFSHTLAMVHACEKENLLSRVVISIQGLCSVYAPHYSEGVPYPVQKQFTLRDFLKQDNLLQQQAFFARRGELEIRALQKVGHVIGRTEWDKACTAQINPKARYHFCNETLRPCFYADRWTYDSCTRHRIFASSCVYPIKGFHYLLEALAEVVKTYPDAVIAVPGRSFLKQNALKERILRNSYQNYLRDLAEKYGLQDRIEFLGRLDAQGMKEQYRRANVFVLPSTIENSPNSLGEAMLLGTPCVAADVGGVTTMLQHEAEGFVYQSTAPYMLAHYIKRVFAMEDAAAAMGEKAGSHARKTHDARKNLQDLLEIYHTVSSNP